MSHRDVQAARLHGEIDMRTSDAIEQAAGRWFRPAEVSNRNLTTAPLHRSLADQLECRLGDLIECCKGFRVGFITLLSHDHI